MSKLLGRMRIAIKKHLVTGVLIFVPLGLTVWLVTWIDGIIIEYVEKLPAQMQPGTYLPFHIPGLGIILSILGIYVIGFLGSQYLGSQVVGLYERLLQKVPGVNWLYILFKQIMESVFRLMEEFQGKGSDRFRGVVLVEYPRKGIYSLAFVTGDSKGEVQKRTDDEVVNVFIPTTPNPTSGFYLMIPKDQLIPLDLTVEKAFRLLMSAGMVGDEADAENKNAHPGEGQALESNSEPEV